MTQNQPRLLLRKHSYYIRIFIPRKLQSVVKRKEIRCSLHTNNYFEALKKLRQESAKIDSWLAQHENFLLYHLLLYTKHSISLDECFDHHPDISFQIW